MKSDYEPIEQRHLDDMALYLPDNRREAIHDDGHDDPIAYIRGYAERFGAEDLVEAAEAVHVDLARAIRDLVA